MSFKRKKLTLRLLVLVLIGFLGFGAILGVSEAGFLQEPPAGRLAITGLGSEPAVIVGLFEKFEITFHVANSVATFPQWPHDPAPPNGIPPSAGISVNALFVDPEGRQHLTPGFQYQQFRDEIRQGRAWHYPTGIFTWKVRFAPNRTGSWKYRIIARDKSGVAESPFRTFRVIESSRKGFIKVSRKDPRYFEWCDGSLFTGLGFAFPPHLEDPGPKVESEFKRMSVNGINLVRMWISPIYGSAWNPYVGGRNHYRGYLPVTGLVPFRDESTGETTLAMRIDYDATGDDGWFDACRLQWWNDPESIKPFTRYRIKAKYRGIGIAGPRNEFHAEHGFVLKLGGWNTECYEPGTGNVVTNYGGNNCSWGYIEGTWNSGNRTFLPRLHLALENVKEGIVYVDSISLREEHRDGAHGPEIMVKPSMEHQLYIPQEKAFSFDKIVEMAERHEVYLKLVVMEKEDKIYLKMADDGEFVTGPDNAHGFYGTGRAVNKTRWLQQAWWRYLQARWGYSTSIHSWELVNEGDPGSTRHYEMADEFGKFMHSRVFEVEPGVGDGIRSSYDHPNDHLVSTSFWHSFPALQFWANPKYPNVDYADIHAYISTSHAPAAEKEKMQWDAAHYHIWHSNDLGGRRIGKPVLRGEAGMDKPGQQSDSALGIGRDITGIWLHNYLWSGLHSGGLYELYWWTSHIWSPERDLRKTYKLLSLFLSGLNLNKGGYADWGGTVSNSSVRVVGQKNTASGFLHLWIQNRDHTWKNVVDGKPISPVSGEISVPGFAANKIFTLEFWDTYAEEKSILASQQATTDSQGNLRIMVQSLEKDVALRGAQTNATSMGFHP
jgi:hypothetical protein